MSAAWARTRSRTTRAGAACPSRRPSAGWRRTWAISYHLGMGAPVYLGIDLGTTNSTAAAFDGDKVVLIRNAQGGPLTPSVVRIDARGAVVVGARARKFLDSDPDNTKSEFKRLMGTAEDI